MSWELCILGANSAVPTVSRFPSGQVLHMGSTSIMIDCGEGSQLRMLEYGIKKARIAIILISHMHGDHIFGLPGLLTSYNLFGRKNPLQIIGPEGIKSFVEYTMGITNHKFTYPIKVKELKQTNPGIIVDQDTYDIQAFSLVHRIPTYGYRIGEKIIRPYLSKKKVQKMKLSDGQVKKLLNGGNIEIGGHSYDLSYFERHPTPRAYAYISDTAYFPECASYTGRVRLMYHEATFLDIDQEQAKERFHSTAREAARTASDADADHLLLGHYSSRYTDIDQFKKEAETVFKPVSLALSGKKFIIPKEGKITES